MTKIFSFIFGVGVGIVLSASYLVLSLPDQVVYNDGLEPTTITQPSVSKAKPQTKPSDFTFTESEITNLRLEYPFHAGEAKAIVADFISRLDVEEFKKGGERITLISGAFNPNSSSSQNRRVSLSNALAIRAELLDVGIRSTVRAMGARLDTNVLYIIINKKYIKPSLDQISEMK